MTRSLSVFLGAAATLFLTACSTTQYSWVGAPRPPVPEDSVVLYQTPQAAWAMHTYMEDAPDDFDLVAQLVSRGTPGFYTTRQPIEQTRRIMQQLRKEAADRGANGVLVRDVQRESHVEWDDESAAYQTYYKVRMEADLIYVRHAPNPQFEVEESVVY